MFLFELHIANWIANKQNQIAETQQTSRMQAPQSSPIQYATWLVQGILGTFAAPAIF